ncbi:AlwI family type II restriction endonuclease [Helicobacter sp. T3_23-1059]
MRKREYKILSFSTTMRNPQRIAEFLKALLPFKNQTLTHEIIMQIVTDLITNKLYVPLYASRNFKEILESDTNFSANQTQEIIKNSPQEHKEAGFDKGWDSRFDTWYKLPMEFGFCYYAINEPLRISNTGHLLIDAIDKETPSNETKITNIFLNCMMKYQSNNPFRRVLNANVPLLLLLNTMHILKQKVGDSKIHKDEISFLLCWRDNDAQKLAQKIVDFRAAYPSFAYSSEVIYKECLEILGSKNEKRFKISQICGESVDEYIRKMRITGIISLRGNGRFLDFNTFEMPKIEYVMSVYSTLKTFATTQEYFAYMGQIDSQILEIKENIEPKTKENLKYEVLTKFAKTYTKEQIYKELKILESKKAKSENEVFKFIPEPTRFEFLSAIALKQNFANLEVLPNYTIDDEGLPRNHASGNQPDIICIDKNSQSIVEVSLICGRAQTHSELLPIARHLKEMIAQTQDDTNFALFIAPKIFEDTKRYARLLKLDENLDIRNLSITEFITNLKTCESINQINV